MSLQEFRDILLMVTDNVYHFEAAETTGSEYIIWQETGGRSLHGGNTRRETVKKVQIELYTDKEFSEMPERIMEVLEENDIAFGEPIPGFDPETKMLRYIIECEVA